MSALLGKTLHEMHNVWIILTIYYRNGVTWSKQSLKLFPSEECLRIQSKNCKEARSQLLANYVLGSTVWVCRVSVEALGIRACCYFSSKHNNEFASEQISHPIHNSETPTGCNREHWTQPPTAMRLANELCFHSRIRPCERGNQIWEEIHLNTESSVNKWIYGRTGMLYFKPIKGNKFCICLLGYSLRFVPYTKHQLPAPHYLAAPSRIAQQDTSIIPLLPHMWLHLLTDPQVLSTFLLWHRISMTLHCQGFLVSIWASCKFGR